MGTSTRLCLRVGLLRRAAIAVLIPLALALAAPALSSAAAPNVTGAWAVTRTCVTGFCAGQTYQYTFNLAQAEGSSTVTGSVGGSYEAGATITGIVSGNSMTLTARSASGYEATGTVTINPEGNSFSGGYSDNKGSTGSITGTRNSETASLKNSPNLENTRTEVACDYLFAQLGDTCTATVGDATGKGVTPTGKVSFLSKTGGKFAGGSSCTLAQSSEGVGVASCSIEFSAPESLVPEIEARYEGDAQHNPSVGSTKYIFASVGSSVESPTIQKFNPQTLSIAVDNPVAGSTLSAFATLTEDLADGAQCSADDASTANASAVASIAKTIKLPNRKPPASRSALTVQSVKRGAAAGEVPLQLHFSLAALRRRFPHTSKLQLIVLVSIKPPSGQSIEVYQHAIVTLRVSHGKVSIGKLQRAKTSALAYAAGPIRTYRGKGPCQEEFTLEVNVPSNVNEHWKATLKVMNLQADACKGMQPQKLNFSLTLDEVGAAAGGEPLLKGESSDGTSVAAAELSGTWAALEGGSKVEFGGGATCLGTFKVIIH